MTGVSRVCKRTTLDVSTLNVSPGNTSSRKKRYNVTNVKRSLKRMRAVKRRTPDINVRRIESEMRFNIAVHSVTSFFGSTAGFSSWDGSGSRSRLDSELVEEIRLVHASHKLRKIMIELRANINRKRIEKALTFIDLV